MLQSKTQIGRRDHRIIIQTSTSTTDEYNAPSVTWSTFATVWASVEDSSFGSHERYESEQLTAIRRTTFNIRYLSGIREKMRILYDDRFYDIEYIGRPDRNRSLDLRCILLDET